MSLSIAYRKEVGYNPTLLEMQRALDDATALFIKHGLDEKEISKAHVHVFQQISFSAQGHTSTITVQADTK